MSDDLCGVLNRALCESEKQRNMTIRSPILSAEKDKGVCVFVVMRHVWVYYKAREAKWMVELF